MTRSKASRISKRDIVNVRYTNTKSFFRFKFFTLISFEVYTESESVAREIIRIKKFILFLFGVPLIIAVLASLSEDTDIKVKSQVRSKPDLDKELKKLLEEEGVCPKK